MVRDHRYDQHFLRNPRLVAELVGHSNIRKNDVVYDLGAGSGVITSVLARRCRQVVAVEVESRALELLRRNTAELANVTIIQNDIRDVKLPATPYKVFANIPFSLSTNVVRRLTETSHPPRAIYLIVQRQFARKLTMGEHFTSQLGAQIAPTFTARVRRPLRKTDFTPPPAVDTALLELKLRLEPLLSAAELPAYRDFVARCFAEQKFYARQPRETAGISSERKPSELDAEQWVHLYRAMADRNRS